MKEITKFIFYWFCTFIIIVLALLLLTALFSSQDSPITIPRNKFPTEVKGQVIDIRVNNETHQYLQYMTSECENNFQLTHWKDCKYCQEKEKVLNKK